jgi:hypothetical protein
MTKNEGPTIKSIDTVYNGFKFRSRLEARWAVFFDSLSIKYDYEKEGFDLDGEWYLPDFWVNNWNCWIEIKPEIIKYRDSIEIDNKDMEKIFRLCRKLSDKSNKVVLLITGSPWIIGTSEDKKLYEVSYDLYDFQYEIIIFMPKSIMLSNNFNKVLIEIGFSLPINDKFFNKLNHQYYSSTKPCSLFWFIKERYNDCKEYFDKPIPRKGDILSLIEADKLYYKKVYEKEHPMWKYDIVEDRYGFIIENGVVALSQSKLRENQKQKLLDVYLNAKQARFEYK